VSQESHPIQRQDEPGHRFAYFYLMKDDPDRVSAITPRHASYWKELGLAHYLGGPFEDRTGGLITFDADDLAEAQRVVLDDPFLRELLVEALAQALDARLTSASSPSGALVYAPSCRDALADRPEIPVQISARSRR
jgi:hypothetical protein